MRPVAVTAVLLLVALTSMSASAWNPGEMCRTSYPATPCRVNVGSGFYQYGPNRCVKAFHEKTFDFLAGQKACRWFPNGDLVSIHSLDEICQVECAMYRATTAQLQYWIGLQRGYNNFVWTDGSYHDYSYWADGEPNDWRSEHCIEMNYKGWGFWNDEKCWFKNPIVCQIKI